MANRYGPPPAHGTRLGYQKHLRDKEKACEECKAANRDESQRKRDDPKSAARTKLYNKAVSRAQTRLKNIYVIEYYALLQEELRELEEEDAKRTS